MKKILILFILIGVIGVCSLVLSSFFGNPISKYIAKKTISNYMLKTYPNKEFEIEKITYNFKTGGYSGKINFKQENINFFITTKNSCIRYDQYQHEYTRDKEIENKLAKQIEQKLLPIIQNRVPEVRNIHAEMYVKKYSNETNYSTELDEELKIFLVMKEKTDNKISKKEFLEKALKAKDIILKNGYKMGYYNCYYIFRNKGDGFELGLYKNEFNLHNNELLNSGNLKDYEYINKKNIVSKGESKYNIPNELKNELKEIAAQYIFSEYKGDISALLTITKEEANKSYCNSKCSDSFK
ncbi:YfjL-like protein [Desulfolucanica intricata]|uniref:YfjL-like protein n=1 Tax=Desulfolucanica intricata TaxID=1285191 RepID=UPI000836111F|nr:DUF3139 domain-containing protein [Desulfolucanica intricata]